MKTIVLTVFLIGATVGVLWILFTDKEQHRQYEYDLGSGEINE